MRHVLSISVLACLLSLGGCGDGDTPLASAGDAGETADSGASDAGSDAGPAASGDAGAARVEWQIEPEPLEIDTDIGLDFYYRYEVEIPGNVLVYTLDVERCSTVAGREETCFTEQVIPPESGGVRWGIDPSQYAIGENRYSFRLELSRGAEVIAEDEIELVVTVTDCQTCVGTDPGEEP